MPLRLFDHSVRNRLVYPGNYRVTGFSYHFETSGARKNVEGTARYFLFRYTMGRVIFTQPTFAPEIAAHRCNHIAILRRGQKKREKKIIHKQ